MQHIVLNDDQAAAQKAILNAFENGQKSFLLKGFAGTGKTSLMQSLVRILSGMRRYSESIFDDLKIRVVVTAPTHKAVQVLAEKLDQSGLGHIEAMTIHSLLGLKPTVGESERQVLKKDKNSKNKAKRFDFVVIDEVSMIGLELQGFIDRELRDKFVLYVGDPAQLPPIGEKAARCFLDIPAKQTVTLNKIVRQAEGNPILKVAGLIRAQQGGQANWDWCAPNEDRDNGAGVYLSGERTEAWMQDAFTRDRFRDDNDTFRYLAFTNERVKQVNTMVRRWIYGETETPFVVGERVICRQPVLNDTGVPVFTTNEEAIVSEIKKITIKCDFNELQANIGQKGLDAWSVSFPGWEITLAATNGSGASCVAYMAVDERDVQVADRRLCAEGKSNRARWYERFSFMDKIADLRPVYAMTCHSSQGSTFENVFVDIPDIAKRGTSNPLEMQKMLYVAVTRASKIVILVGV